LAGTSTGLEAGVAKRIKGRYGDAVLAEAMRRHGVAPASAVLERPPSGAERATSAALFGYCESPIGLIEIGATPDGIASLLFVERRGEGSAPSSIVDEAVRQLREYFAGSRRQFDLPLDLTGTEFQRLVWRHLLTVPFGQTASYRDVAAAIGKPRAVRAVGAANGQNPISIIVPCHRIVGSDGRLVGYGGGLWRKEWLLKHEGLPTGKVAHGS
jgi:methylated-DNA-[protein]-cysteine S-methyltransferase